VSAKFVTEVSKINGTSEINSLLTDYSNAKHITTKQKQFLEIAIRINSQNKRPFSCYDFPLLSRNNFRQMVYKLHDFIEVYIKSHPCFYKIKGVYLPKSRVFVTDGTTGGDMIAILKKLREQPPKIHDIKLKFKSNIHQFLSKLGEKVNPANKSIQYRFRLDDFARTNVSVYPHTVVVDLGCTHKPLAYDICGVIQMAFYLGQIKEALHLFSRVEGYIPPLVEWIVTHYHFGKDGSESYSGQSFHLTFDDVATGLVRFYSKKMLDGKVVPRIEQIQTPNSSFDKEIEKIICKQDLND